jgi:hypothetical protein
MTVQITCYLTNTLTTNTSLIFFLWFSTFTYAWPANTNISLFVRSYVPTDIWRSEFSKKKKTNFQFPFKMTKLQHTFGVLDKLII